MNKAYLHIPFGQGYVLPYPRFLHYIGYGVSAYCAASLFQHHVVSWSSSRGPSMYPTFANEATTSVVSHLHRRGAACRVGDIVQLRHPLFPHMFAGKRILGMPGDYVVKDADRAASVGGAATPVVTAAAARPAEPEMLRVPEGHVWVAGDNMAWSRDSRVYGAVPMALIEGKIIAVVGRNWLDWKYYGEEGELREVPTVEED